MKSYKYILIIIFIVCFYPAAGIGVQVGSVDIHGFMSQGYLKSDDNNYMARTEDGTNQFREMGINFNYNINPKLRAAAQLFAKDLGPFYNNKVELDWAVIDYSFIKWLGFRAGKLKAPLGFHNATRDYDMLRVCTILPQSVYLELNRNSFSNIIGGETYGNFNVKWIGTIDYQFMVGTQRIDEESGTIKRLEEIVPVENTKFRFDEDLGQQRIKIKIDNMFTLSGLTWQFVYENVNGMYNDTTPTVGPFAGVTSEIDYNYFHAWTHSISYRINELTVTSEFLNRRFKIDVPGLMTYDKISNFEGWYIGCEYQLLDEFAMGAYWSVFYNDTKNDGYKDNSREYNKDIAVSLKYDVSEYWILKGEVHNMEGVAGTTDELLGGSTNYDKDWWLYAVKISLYF